MPYNPSTGVYSLPAIYLAIPGTVIIAAQHNTPLEDLATANNYARPIIAGGTGASNSTLAATNLEVVSINPQSWSDAQKTVARENIDAAEISARPTIVNALINGDGAIRQQVVSTAADDGYGWDCNYVLTQTASIGVSSVSAPTGGLASMMRATQSQASAQRMGIAQIVKNSTSLAFRGEAAGLAVKLRCSASQAIRFAILEWTGTPDTAVTSDVVNNWTSTSYTAGGFFISSNLVVTAVGSITPAANTITDFELPATIGATANNIIVFCWTEGTAAQNVTLDLAWALGAGTVAADAVKFSIRPNELSLCQEFFTSGTFSATGLCATGATLQSWREFPTEMIFTPTISLGSATATNITGIAATGVNTKGSGAAGTGTTGSPTNSLFSVTYTADARL